jgi:hypothetical protein
MSVAVYEIHGLALVRGAYPLSLCSLPQAGLGGERNSRSRALRTRHICFGAMEARA